jgi:hypothetical protein
MRLPARKDDGTMTWLKSLWTTVRSWRPGRRDKPHKRATVAVERLDHRQLLSVNFTGNVFTDFPATTQPGVVVLPANSSDIANIAQIPPALQPIIKMSGFSLEAIRVSYDRTDDTLNFGIQQPGRDPADPLSPPVLAGDADNNGDSGTVNPAVSFIDPTFMDPPDFGGSETMGIFLDLNNDSVPDIVAGFPRGPATRKLYEVANAVNGPPGTVPDFGTSLPQFTGGFFTFNNPATPAFEFNIKNFSQLYQQKTGQTLTPDDNLVVGAFAGSLEARNAEAVLTPKPFNIGDATRDNCPPAEPPILINPHENRHVNIAHPTDVRVTIFGSAGFDVDDIIPQSVMLGGASPIFSFTRFVNNDPYPDATFVFRGTDIDLPPGRVDAVVTGQLIDFRRFESTYTIHVKDDSFYTDSQLAAREARWESVGGRENLQTPMQKRLQHTINRVSADEDPSNDVRTLTVANRSTVTIRGRNGQPVRLDSQLRAIEIGEDQSGRSQARVATQQESAPAAAAKVKIPMRKTPQPVIVDTGTEDASSSQPVSRASRPFSGRRVNSWAR